jgi:pilus assembly protein CpaB
MNFRRMTTALVMALLISGLCTYLLSRKMKGPSNHPVAEQKYVTPAHSMQAGEILKADNMELITWPTINPIPGAFTKPDDLIGRSLLYPMDKGQPITDKLVTAIGAGVGLAGKIPNGMRAIALRSDEVMGVAGFLLPGSHVDVLVTYRTDKSPEPTTATVLQDSEVIAAGHQIQPDPEGKPATVTVVTLLLTPDDAERAVLASTQGTIHFVLRSGSDKEKVVDAPMLMSELSSKPASTRAGLPTHVSGTHSAPHPAQTQFIVETILGDKVTTTSFSMAAK